MLRLKKLVIHRYRSVPPGTTLEFSDGVNAILGKNGSGKTTLLNLIVMILRGDFSSLKDEPEGAEFEFTTVRTGGPTDPGPFEAWIKVGVMPANAVALPAGWAGELGREGAHPQEHRWFAEARFHDYSGSMTDAAFSIGSERESVFSPPLTKDQVTRPRWTLRLLDANFIRLMAFFAVAHDWSNLPMFAYTNHRGQHRFDEGLDSFGLLVGRNDEVVRSAHADEAWVRVNSLMESNLLPWEITALFMEKNAKGGAAVDGSHSVTFDNGDSPTLAAISRLLALHSTTATPKLIKSSPEAGGTRTYRGWDFYFTWPDGSGHDQNGLSFGQKRMLAFLWYLGCIPESPVVADELVNGFHYTWLEALLPPDGLIGERQAFLASQNPLLLDFMRFDDPESVRHSFVFCDVQATEQGRTWTWRHPDADEADSFFRAYDVGIQHVSEILRAKGLW